ncbi:MAG: hypothetical protein ACK4RK_14245 [Gemmataceae bacterium]
MSRRWFLTLSAVLALTTVASAQTPWRFHWQPNQVLTYRVEQQTTTSFETQEDGKAEFTVQLNLVKRWQVTSVDSQGVATLHMSLASLRMEQHLPDGEVLLFDSTQSDAGESSMGDQLNRYIGQTLAVLRIDNQGRIVDVTESKFGPASRYVSDLPFKLTLPDAAPSAGQKWQRVYDITLEPPDGTGEKIAARQFYECQKVTDQQATIRLTTSIPQPPESVADRVPLLQYQPQGELTFDVRTGILRQAVLTIDESLPGFQGEGSNYHFRSTYKEVYVGDN